jgi:uncharacterized protein
MKPSFVFEDHREMIKSVIARYSVANPRLFGSIVTGKDHDGSDIDLLVDALPGTTFIDLCSLQDELEDMLGVSVDLRTPQEISLRFRDKVLAEARPV